MYLMPNPDRDVLLRDPRSMVALPSYGGNVSNSSYWVRREKDGDALPTTKEKVAEGRAAAKKKADADAKSDAEAKAAKVKADAEAKAKAAKANKTTGSKSQ